MSRLQPQVRAAIEQIDESAWTTLIDYPSTSIAQIATGGDRSSAACEPSEEAAPPGTHSQRPERPGAPPRSASPTTPCATPNALAEQAELAYRRNVADWQATRPTKAGASATQGHASKEPSKG